MIERGIALAVAFAALVAAWPLAAAQPESPDAGPVAESVDWSSAPRADRASGLERDPDRGDGALWIPRVLLFLPKWAFIIVAAPVRLSAWTYERYQLRDRFQQVFFNVDGTFGVFPTVFFETGFGLNIGARLVHRDLFGKSEHLRLRSGFGGEFEQVYEASVSSGERLGDDFSLSLQLQYQKRPKDLFFGIGNGEQGAPGMMIDPTVDDTQVKSTFRQNVARATLRGQLGITDDVAVLPSVSWVFREFADRTILDNFDPDGLTAFETDASNVYGEVELRYDTRARASLYESTAVDAKGWLLAGHLGWQQGFADDPSSFLRYGADLQTFVNLYKGNRVLALRLYIDAVARTGGAVSEIPFVDLPRLGGATLLRGYDPNRFRDRIVALGTIEYLWDIGMFGSGFLFADAGRPYRVWEEVSVDDMRLGFGGGIEIHTKKSFVGRFHVASSIDGGLFLSLGFSPIFGRRERVGRF